MTYQINLSYDHINAACFLAKLTYDLELKYTANDFTDEIIQQHRAYSIGSIISAVSYLEATINELFFDVANQLPRVKVEHLPNGTPDRMKAIWEHIEKNSILDKYKIALIFADKSYDIGKEPYQSVQDLISLRNAVVHYKPELIDLADHKNDQSQKLEKKIKSKIKKQNPWTGKDNPFFPDKCLGYGCAFWAIKSSVAFTKEFFPKMGLNFHNDQEDREPYFMKAVDELPKVN